MQSRLLTLMSCGNGQQLKTEKAYDRICSMDVRKAEPLHTSKHLGCSSEWCNPSSHSTICSLQFGGTVLGGEGEGKGGGSCNCIPAPSLLVLPSLQLVPKGDLQTGSQ